MHHLAALDQFLELIVARFHAPGRPTTAVGVGIASAVCS